MCDRIARQFLDVCEECNQIVSFGKFFDEIDGHDKGKDASLHADDLSEEWAISSVQRQLHKSSEAGKLPGTLQALQNQVSSMTVRYQVDVTEIVSLLIGSGRVVEGADDSVSYTN